jgi:hypothetical protein
MSKLRKGLMAFVLAAGCSDPVCEDASCSDALFLTLRVPETAATYDLAFETEAGSTTCWLTVPIRSNAHDCDGAGEEIARFGQTVDDYAIDVVLPRTSSVTVTVSEGGSELHTQTIRVEASDFQPVEDTQNSCGGGCKAASESLDLTSALSGS